MRGVQQSQQSTHVIRFFFHKIFLHLGDDSLQSGNVKGLSQHLFKHLNKGNNSALFISSEKQHNVIYCLIMLVTGEANSESSAASCVTLDGIQSKPTGLVRVLTFKKILDCCACYSGEVKTFTMISIGCDQFLQSWSLYLLRISHYFHVSNCALFST